MKFDFTDVRDTTNFKYYQRISISGSEQLEDAFNYLYLFIGVFQLKYFKFSILKLFQHIYS